MKKLLLIVPLMFCLPVIGAEIPVYKQVSAPLEKRVDDLVRSADSG